MTNVIQIRTKFSWKVSPPTADHDSYVASCPRLGLSVEAVDLDYLVVVIDDAMNALFKDLWEQKEFNEYAFKHSIDFTVTDDTHFVEVSPLPVIVEEVV